MKFISSRSLCGVLVGVAMGLCITACLSVGANRRAMLSDVEGQGDKDYSQMSAEDILTEKLGLMQPFVRGEVERDILQKSYEALRWGRANGKWLDVNLEDLMAEARQESNLIIDLFEKGADIAPAGGVGTTIWDYHSIASQDLTHSISFSVWQPVEVEYLMKGREMDPEIEVLYQQYIVKYALDGNDNVSEEIRYQKAWSYRKKIKDMEGEEKSGKMLNDLIDKITAIVAKKPQLHPMIMAALLQEHHKHYGVRSPNSIRSYFLLSIQKNLNPKNWLAPVRFNDDIVPSAVNGYTDNNAAKRGDYGKQVALGNTYNDRGMVFWYGVTRDRKTLRELVAAWQNDPARLTRQDYQAMRDAGYLKYADKNPEIFQYVMQYLSNPET